MNFFLARDGGLPLIAVGALIDGALGGLLSVREHGIERLSDLRGKRIGYSLEPLEPVLWRTMLAAAGLNPGEYELIYTGMSTLPALLSGAGTAIGAFRNYERLAVEVLGALAKGVEYTLQLPRKASPFSPRFSPSLRMS